MEFFKKLKQSIRIGRILKIAGIAILAIIALAVFSGLFSKLFGSHWSSRRVAQEGYENNFGISYPGRSQDLSAGLLEKINTVADKILPPDGNEFSSGDNAEDYEVTQYSSTIKTRNLEDDCNTIAGLKAKDYVIFEKSDQYETGCNYTFKTEKDHVKEILTVIESLNPRQLYVNTYTIKKQVENITSNIEILEAKKAAIEATLANATKSYDDITKLATSISDVDSLAKIINGKISVIERLTQERLNVSAQLETAIRNKNEQLDRLAYTYFQINVTDNKFINIDYLKDSWQARVKKFVVDVNIIFQDVTVGLFAVLLYLLKFALYLLIVLIAAKYFWQLTKYIFGINSSDFKKLNR
ncbi:hypothetical protein C4572_03940 [Candidatus Parcubacteria bacterium]|nr:MAG: hypothetical protein C4572_03940 [Candidatus Parcubacteria bacterium]